MLHVKTLSPEFYDGNNTIIQLCNLSHLSRLNNMLDILYESLFNY